MITFMNRNLRLGYLYTVCAYFGIGGLWVMFLQQRGLTLVQIGLCESLFHLTGWIFEVPAGILADRFSYRTMLILSRLAAVGHGLIMLTAHDFWWFLFGFFLLGWAANLQNGTLEALLYETLVDGDQTKRYPQVTSTMNTILKVAGMVGLTIAGWLIQHHAMLTYQLYLVGAGSALLIAIFLHEPQQHQQRARQLTLWQIVKAAFIGLKRTPKLTTLMLFNAIFIATGYAYYSYFQSVMTAHGFKSAVITGILVVITLLNVLSVQLTPKLQQRWSAFKILRTFSLILLTVLLITGVNRLPVLVIGDFIVNMLMAAMAPLMSSYYNELVSSGERATLLSVSSMFYSIIMSLSFPIIGWLIERVGFAASFAWIGSGLLVLTLIGYLLTLKFKH
ncbi:MFS transporter [Lactobacillus paraplantarum] [Lactiplantibacillus mudanjiangensis]|uniref:MFS transporter n=2 Tax=Lactiplantibacillus mudanjiangensis TaxID=1296538 RepID=UPI00101496FE|nr:MFS transporter [Lactiplantibacillus mudanjiangensis]VDG18377.1 MFS transporter [Lactobacillus paraplantarum] [Lactiplantibacillus mudanjiangensis]VDG33639.1 MFS transporter [Lactobacillus paraplantarum] [Lactiplantibacillus mudanjiangensis]